MAPLQHDPTTTVPARPGTARRWADERGAILVSSLVKLVLVVGIVGVVGYDSLSIVRTQVELRDEASQAAQVAHDALREHATVQEAAAAAVAYATAHGATVPRGGVAVAKDGSVTVTLTATAPTLVAGRISALDEYTTPVETGVARNSIY